MAKPKLFLGTIFVDRGAIPAFYYSLCKLATSGLVDLTLSMHGHGDGGLRQLNRRVAHFLENTTDDYFWLQGNDTDFQPEYIAHMAGLGHPIVCGLFPIKQPELRWCIQPCGAATDATTGELEVRAAGLECMMIHRDVFRKMAEAKPDLRYRDNVGGPAHTPLHLSNFWRWELRDGPDGEKMLQSEDYLFCDDARALGYKIIVDTSGYCGHWDCRVRFPLKAPPMWDLKTPPAKEGAGALTEPAKA
jgi:hypothetical protein